MAAQVDDAIKSINEVAETKLIGGNKRQLTVRFDPLLLASRNLTVTELAPKIQAVNSQSHSGSLKSLNQEIQLQTGTFLQSAEEIGRIVVGVYGGKPVYLHEVAEIIDGPAEPADYVLYGDSTSNDPRGGGHPVDCQTAGGQCGFGGQRCAEEGRRPEGQPDPCRPSGERHPRLRGDRLGKVQRTAAAYGHCRLRRRPAHSLFPRLAGIDRRHAGHSLDPCPDSLVFYLYGYTLNRITLFALIFSIGILVDDAIVVVENIVRHLRCRAIAADRKVQVAIEAVAEVGNPTILATLAVIAAILPMAFVGGLMGPYMRPIPIGSSAAMVFSLIIAFTVTPWAATHILKKSSCRPRS